MKGKVSPGVYQMRNGATAEVWKRDAINGNPLYPFFGALPESPDDDAWDDGGRNWASADFDLVHRVGPLAPVESR